ncbi:MAG: hypothetical protein GPJ54_18900 [Candidatus Heimdallarchaeota archaeon]|nr:hypothetical protein [Candidatus Heimdallarchaeota archaeon]
MKKYLIQSTAMFVANDVRILVKGFAITIFVLGMFYPIITVAVDAESTDSNFDPFTDDLLIINTNTVFEAEIKDSNDEAVFTEAKQDNIYSWSYQVFLFVGIVILALSLLADLLEKDEGFIGEWFSTFTGFVMLLTLYGLIRLKLALLESEISNEGGRSLYDRIDTSRGTVSFYASINESIILRLMELSLLLFILLPISNRLIKEVKVYNYENQQKTTNK